MKKALLILALGLTFAFTSMSQNQALGLRLGGGNSIGAEFSYLHPLSSTNRIEADLGLATGAWGISGIYDWVFPIESGFSWYAGPGASIGAWNTKDENGLYVGICGNIGVEYDFNEIPIQISLDARPQIGIIANGNPIGTSLGLGIRYLF